MLDRDTALKIFSELEKERHELGYGYDGEKLEAPTYNVRLDAMTYERSDERGFRLFIRVENGVPAQEDALRFVLDQAKEHELAVEVENGGVELTGRLAE